MFNHLIDSVTKQHVGDTSVHAVLGTSIQVIPYAGDQQSGLVSWCWWIRDLFWCADTQIEKDEDIRQCILIEYTLWLRERQQSNLNSRRELYVYEFCPSFYPANLKSNSLRQNEEWFILCCETLRFLRSYLSSEVNNSTAVMSINCSVVCSRSDVYTRNWLGSTLFRSHRLACNKSALLRCITPASWIYTEGCYVSAEKPS